MTDSTTTATRTDVVLTLDDTWGDPRDLSHASFEVPESDDTSDVPAHGAPFSPHLLLPTDVWADMGYPGTITVTLRPGDHATAAADAVERSRDGA